jgi:CBS domain-containing protein
MEFIPTIDVNSKAQDAASLLIKQNSDIAAVLKNDILIGVVTDWDITKAMAENACDVNLDVIMTKNVVTADPNYSIIEIVRELEQYQISAMPVVEDGKVLGKIHVDLIAQRYILHSLKET